MDKKNAKREINDVLYYQDIQLKELSDNKLSINTCVEDSETLLKELGYQLPSKTEDNKPSKKVINVQGWHDIVEQAEKCTGSGHEIEDLFSQKELIENSIFVKTINDDFKQIYRLDKIDYTICICCGLLAAVTDILLVGIPGPGVNGTEAGPLSDWIRDRFHEMIPDEKVAELEKFKYAKVPYDAQDRNTLIYVEGLSAYYHRLLEIGHDPLLGFIVGVYDIMHGSMTTIDKRGMLVNQVMENYSDRIETRLFDAIAKEFLHLMSDVNTSMGLPAPLMSLFNFLQVGKIGEDKLNIAEIVQGMYYQGYDFIHFCSMSIPVMLVEVLTRVCYTAKRMREGIPLKDAVAITTDREKNPKLGTMMFIAHSIAAASNAGKVYLSKRPEAINYPQWIVFAVNSYKQLKWSMIDKPELAEEYYTERIYEELSGVYESIDSFIEENYTLSDER